MPTPAGRAEARDEVIFAGGLIVDGTGRPGAEGDVVVAGSRIKAILPPGEARGRRVVDCSGMIVSPGFVDIHSHADYTVLADGRAHSSVLQGVTSIVTGNCGHGIAPATERARELAPMNIPGWDAMTETGEVWESFSDYLGLLRQRGLGLNVFPLVAHGALRVTVAGFDDRPLTEAEIARMRALVVEAMQAGAIGVSSGLEYAPGWSADVSELERVVEPVGGFGGLYATHVRNRTDRMVEATEEAVRIARFAKARLQLSHFIRRPSTPEAAELRSWAILEEASAAGLVVRSDVFPFDYGPTPLASMLPPWARSGTRAETAARLCDPAIRARVLAGLGPMFEAAVKRGVAESMYVAAAGGRERWIGRTLGEIARATATGIPEAAYDLLAEAGENFYNVSIVERWADWLDLERALKDSRFFLMGDGVTVGLDGPLRRFAFSLSDWGYAPRFLGQFVRDLAIVTLEDAIARMTWEPAKQIGLTDRGALRPGMQADLAVFDLARIGSAVRPDHLRVRPTGMHWVMVNGRFVVEQGEPTNARPGIVGLDRGAV